MTTLYKLTTQDYKTRAGESNETQWGKGVTHTAGGSGALCSDAWIHAYTHPLLAVIFNPIHASIDNPVLWKCEGVVGKTDSTKVGCTSLTTLKTIALPDVTIEQRVKFAILGARATYREPAFLSWSAEWLAGTTEARAKKAAWAAAAVTAAEAEAWAAVAVVEAAAWAAEAAAWAAEAEAWAVEEAAEWAAQAAAQVAEEAAEKAAEWAAQAAAQVAEAEADIDLIALARQAVSNAK